MRKILVLMIIVLIPVHAAIAGGGHQHGPNGEHLGGAFTDGQVGGPVVLTDKAIQNLGIKTISVEETLTAPTRALYGKVVAHPKQVTSVGARFNGRVEKLFIIEGDKVNAGDPLVRVRPIQAGGNPVTLSASQTGYVTRLNVSRGVTFQSGEELVEVSDLSALLFRGELFDSRLVEQVKIGVPCSVILTALPQRNIRCKVESVDSVFRGTPPVLYIYSSIPNEGDLLKLNMSGKIHIDIGESVLRKLVPKEAVLGEFSDRFVFIREGNSFERKQVVLGVEQGSHIEIKSGLRLGDEVVKQGHYQLQFATSSAEVDDHSHAHGEDEHVHGEDEHVHGEDEHSHD